MRSINVMITDDHILMREGIKQLLEIDGSIKVIAEAGNGVDCIRILEQSEVHPEVLLLDINMPRRNGIEVLKEIRRKGLDIKVLMLTVHGEIEYLLEAVEIGVDGYILKDSGSKELKKAITAIKKGENYIQPSLIPALNAKLLHKNEDKDKLEKLTNREIEILIQIAKGMLNKEIALLLDISERTVKNHVSNIFKKIQVADRTQAAVFAIRNDLINLD